MIKNRDFIFTGLQPWDVELGSNAKDIARLVSKHNRVIYVNTPLDWITLIRNKPTAELIQRKRVLKGELPVLRQLSDTFWVLDFPFAVISNNKIPNARLFDLINKLNNRRMFTFINRIADELGFRNTIHFNDNDLYRSYYAKDFLHAELSVYYRRDNLTAVDFWKRHGSRLEPELIRRSDLVLANSQYLANMSLPDNRNSYYIGQGVELSAYDANVCNQLPDDLIDIKGPIIGYAGFLTSLRLDINLIYQLAQARGDCSFVLVGPQDQDFENHQIHELSNVYFTGNKPSNEIPRYIASFDVCLNPQLVNEVTIGNYPRKIDEYLALGKPVLATNTPAMQIFSDHVYLCSTFHDYLSALDAALSEQENEHKRSNRITFAKSHTWENSVGLMYEFINNYIQEQ